MYLYTFKWIGVVLVRSNIECVTFYALLYTTRVRENKKETNEAAKDREKTAVFYAERQAIIFTKCQIIHQHTVLLCHSKPV